MNIYHGLSSACLQSLIKLVNSRRWDNHIFCFDSTSQTRTQLIFMGWVLGLPIFHIPEILLLIQYFPSDFDGVTI